MSFERIWKEQQVHLKNFIKSKVNNPEQAEDILQEIGIKLHKALEEGKEIQNYSSWIFQVTRNTISDYYRKKTAMESRSAVWPGSETNHTSESCVCDLSGFIIKNYLPEKYGSVLYLSDIEQMPQKEIATQMGLSISATKCRIRRGRQKLRELVLQCVDIEWNGRGEPADYHLKASCQLPEELQSEMKRINLFI